MKKFKENNTITDPVWGETLILDADKLNEIPSISHDQLLKALYWIWDAMERSSLTLILVGKTADSVIANRALSGNEVTVAVRKNEWDSGARRVMDTFAPPMKDNGDTVEYEYEGVPVVLHVLEDDETLSNADTKIYHSEYFKIPNPYSLFLEKYPQFV